MAQHFFDIHKPSPSFVRFMDRVALFGRRGAYSSLPPSGADAGAQSEAIADFSISASQIARPTNGPAISSAMPTPASGSSGAEVDEYCEVRGSIKQVDSSASPIRFPVNLPTQWNDQNPART